MNAVYGYTIPLPLQILVKIIVSFRMDLRFRQKNAFLVSLVKNYDAYRAMPISDPETVFLPAPRSHEVYHLISN